MPPSRAARPARRLPRRVLAAVAVLALAGCGGAAAAPAPATPVTAHDPALAADLPADVRAAGVLTVASDAAYPPLSSYAADGRTVVGFEPDLLRAIGRVLGLRVDVVRTDFAAVLGDVERGRVDAAMAAITDTAERRARVDFVDYFSAGTSVVVQRGNPHGISDLRGLCGRPVAVEAGTVHVDLLERVGSGCDGDGPRVRALTTNADALVELRTGRVAAVLSDYPPAARLTTQAQTRGHFQLASTAQYEPGLYGIAVARDEPALRDALLAALEHVMASGEYDAALDAWQLTAGGLERAGVNGGGAPAVPAS